MITDIIVSAFIIGFFFFFYKVGQAFVDKESLLSKIFAIGSIALSTFLIGLVIST